MKDLKVPTSPAPTTVGELRRVAKKAGQIFVRVPWDGGSYMATSSVGLLDMLSVYDASIPIATEWNAKHGRLAIDWEGSPPDEN